MALEFRILQENFQKILDIVSPAVPSRTPMEFLQGVHIYGEDNNLVFSTSDLNIRIDAKAPAMVINPGSALVDFKLLNSQVRALPADAVDVTVNYADPDNINAGVSLDIACGSASARLYCDDPAKFPACPETPEDDVCTIPADIMAKNIHMVYPCVADNNDRPALTAVYFTIDPDQQDIITSAADGFRLARLSSQAEVNAPRAMNFIIRQDAAQVIERTARRFAGDAKIHFNDNHARFSFSEDATVLTTQLMNVTPINFENYIPEGNLTRSLQLTTQDLRNASNAVATIAESANNTARIYVKPPAPAYESGSIAFVASSSGQFSRLLIPAADHQSDAYPPNNPEDLPYVAVNQRYIRDFAQVAAGYTEATLAISSQNEPIRLTADDGRFVYVAMPLYVPWPDPNAPPSDEFDDTPPAIAPSPQAEIPISNSDDTSPDPADDEPPPQHE